MPNFEVHNQYAKYAVIFTGIGCIAIDIVSGGYGLKGAISIPIAIFSTYMLSPDLDQRCNGSLRYWPNIFDCWWRIYAWMFNHRGLSHIPVIGTLTRVVWLLWPFYLLFELTILKRLLYQLLGASVDYNVSFFNFIKYNIINNLDIIKYICFGLEFPAWMHYAMDFPETARKLIRNRREKRRLVIN